MEPRKLHLVQRVRLRRPEDRRPERGSIDGVFVFDYMGSAEFEWGALPTCLKELRAAPVLPAVQLRAAAGQVAWFVGRPELQSLAQAFFEGELRHPYEDRTPKPYYLKEPSRLYGSYNPDPERGGYDVYEGWWAVDEGHSWALFRTEEAAELWRVGLAQPASGGTGKTLLAKISEKLGTTRKGRGPRGYF